MLRVNTDPQRQCSKSGGWTPVFSGYGASVPPMDAWRSVAMKNLGRATWPLILSLGILSACGDGAGDTPGGFDIGGDSSSDASGEQTEITLDIGTGEGSSFQSGALSLSAPSLSAGGSTEVSFSVVNCFPVRKPRLRYPQPASPMDWPPSNLPLLPALVAAMLLMRRKAAPAWTQ